jgi:hypothetical protein
MNQPIGATATIKWLSDGEIVEGYFFSFGEEGEFNEQTGDYALDSNGFEDGFVFFWCDGEHALKSYMTEGIEDFIVLSYELEYEEITA